ncbi:hypothetical protein COU61_02470 [Candidatus Pacearchaeota archaeon CG10_big_fil_rev_8_21_14_0_10_35_13]|nr:MAG: hypothetical protein COU61_02470 [Candidatus Pacearchaeota archaeon CG10_big_fil_rev_8_21_14_0_10_35_13]
MFNWLFKKKGEMKEVKEETKKAFQGVKQDIQSVTAWIEHLKKSDDELNSRVEEIDEKITTIEEGVEEIRKMMSVMGNTGNKQMFKTQTAVYHKQTGSEGVQTAVQTAVQTGEIAENMLKGLSVMERALVMVLMSTDMKLSYDDLSAMLGKSRATIRGQINSIKQKSEGLVEEIVEKSGKKRVFIPEEVKELLLKGAKVRVREKKKK